jgi:hypothetical protein
MKRIKPTSDLAMKKVLTSKGNEDILCGLINDLFDISATIDEISIDTPYNIEAYKEYVNNMETRVLRQTVKDIAATLKRADFIIKIGIFELTKANLETTNQRHWRDYFLKGSVDDDAPDYIKKASRIIELDNLDEEERRVATIYELAEEAWENDVSGAWLQGRDDGEVIGIAKGEVIGIESGKL